MQEHSHSKWSRAGGAREVGVRGEMGGKGRGRCGAGRCWRRRGRGVGGVGGGGVGGGGRRGGGVAGEVFGGLGGGACTLLKKLVHTVARNK